MTSFISLFSGFLLFVSPIESPEWKQTLDKDDIIVYTRQPATSRFNEIKAITTTEGTFEKFKEIISNLERYPEWLADCKSATLLQKTQANDFTYHMKLKVPFPFVNRDLVQQIKILEENRKLEVKIINHPTLLEEQKNYVRMPVASGRWIVKKMPENKLSITFEYLADPGGNIPAWLVNAFSVKNPHKAIKNLREILVEG